MTYEQLLKVVNYHCNLYYNKSKSEISDLEYDDLCDKLQEKEEAQGWISSDSPTIKIGGLKGKIKHKYKLYSLQKAYKNDNFDTLYDIKTGKIDGTNLTLTYKNDVVYIALTRGDGEFGDSVIHLTPYIHGIPKMSQVSEHIKEFTVTGECVTDNTNITNFRNYVSGALGLKDVEAFKTRNIRFIAHDWLGVDLNYTTKMNVLKSCGFNTVLEEDFCSVYPQDGIVYRYDNFQKCLQLGYTSKYPRFAIALKSREELVATTVLQNIEWAVGRTGTVNPVGIVSPTDIDGAIITRVTLHNYDFIKQHNLRLGDTIEIERAGGVIPKLVRVIASSNNNELFISDVERAIGGKVRQEGPRLYVEDQEAHGTVKLLKHFIKTIGIKGLGIRSVEKMNITHPVDLYKPQKWDILGVNGKKIQKEIEISKTKPYKTVLAALGIEGVGKTASETIVKHITSFTRLKDDIDYIDIPTIGPKTINKILSWLDINEEWVLTLPLNLEADYIEEIDKLKICISGKLDMTKAELSSYLDENYEVVENVTKECHAVIYAKENSTKVDKAKRYSIKIVDYWENKKRILAGYV